MHLPAVLQRPSMRALLLVALSFLGWGSWALASPYLAPYGGLSGWFSDHVSHMNAARLFTQCGTCVWKAPADAFLRHYSDEERAQLPDDLRLHMTGKSPLYVAPGGSLDKPLLLNWPTHPRPYPPGALLLSAPAALAYHFTPLSFTGASRLLVLSYLLYAHVGLFFVLRWLLSGSAQPLALGLLGGFLLYSETVRWSLEGFYDGALLAPLALCGYFLIQRRGLAALVCYCVAAFIHYRAFFFAPLSLYALYLLFRERKREPWGVRQWVAMGAVAVLGGASLQTFGFVAPSLSLFPLSNPLRSPETHGLLHLLVGGGLAAVALLYARAWLDLALLGWLGMMLPRIYQTQTWHALSLLMWLALPVWTSRSERVPLVRDVRLAFVWMMAVLVYEQSLLPARLVEYL
jgi:hypothetical protein